MAAAAGFIDGLEWGNNAKAAVIRVGIYWGLLTLIGTRGTRDAKVWINVLSQLQKVNLH